nr:hypothetical protein [Paracoccus litorisediminis]
MGWVAIVILHGLKSNMRGWKSAKPTLCSLRRACIFLNDISGNIRRSLRFQTFGFPAGYGECVVRVTELREPIPTVRVWPSKQEEGLGEMNFQIRHGHSGHFTKDQNDLTGNIAPSRALIDRLTRRHYSSVLELGCSPVTAHAELARRADRFLALDDDAAHVAAAQTRLICRPQARVRQTSVPRNWPRREFDLIVISEMIARLNLFEQRELARRCAESLSDCGELVLLCDLEDSASVVQRIAAIEEFRRAFGRLRQLEINRHTHAGSVLHLTILARGPVSLRACPEFSERA